MYEVIQDGSLPSFDEGKLPSFDATAFRSVDGKEPSVDGTQIWSVMGTDLHATTFNMINVFIGAGLLTVPFAFRLAGYGAVVALAVVAAMNWATSLMLGQALEKAAKLYPDVSPHAWDMPTLGRVCFGPAADQFIRVLVAVELWVLLETFIILIGINVSSVLNVPRSTVIVVSGVVGMMSLALPMRIVAAFSCLGVWCMGLGFLALVACGVGHAGTGEEALHTPLEPWGMPSAVGICMYCFSGLPCLPHIRAAMRQPDEYSVAVNRSFVFSIVYYSLIGLLGYHFFGHETAQSFTENLWPTPGMENSAFYTGVALFSAVLFATKLQSGYPLVAAPVLGAFGFGEVQEGDFLQRRAMTWIARGGFATVSVVFALCVENAIDAVAELMGAFLTSFTSILFPCGVYWAMCRASGERLSKTTTVGLVALMSFGIAFCVFGTFLACQRILAEETSIDTVLQELQVNVSDSEMDLYPSIMNTTARSM